MSKITNLLYGAVLVLVALDAMITEYVANFSSDALPIIVIIMGVLVLLTPIRASGPEDVGGIRSGFNKIRQWGFGVALIILGVASSAFFDSLISKFVVLSNFTLNTFVGQIVLLLIGVIYFLAAFARTRQINVTSY